MNLTLPKNIMKRGHSYAVRYTVPSDLEKVVGKREIVRGLGHRNLALAVAKGDAVLAGIKADLFAKGRARILPKAEAQLKITRRPNHSVKKGVKISEAAAMVVRGRLNRCGFTGEFPFQ